MLKNIAIPLMLSASEAEAQSRRPTKETVREAFEADLKAPFDGLIAAAAACTAETDLDGATGIAAKAATVGTKEAAVEAKQGEIDTLVKATTYSDAEETVVAEAGGAWFTANAAREAAVALALASEAESDIAAKLNAFDAAANAERAAAHTWLEADKNYQAALVTATNAQNAFDAAELVKGNLETAKTAAETAVSNAFNQLEKELLWRQWAYCELGAVPTNAKANDGGDTAPSSWWAGFGSAIGLTSCVVPAVPNGCTTNVDCVREAVTYHTQSSGSEGSKTAVIAETADGSVRSNATLKHELAVDATLATTDDATAGTDRTKAGDIAYYNGLLKQLAWQKVQRTQERDFYKSVKQMADWASPSAEDMFNDNTYAIAAGADRLYTVSSADDTASSLKCATSTTVGCLFWSNGTGSLGTAAASGAAKTLSEGNTGTASLTYLRENGTNGSLFNLPTAITANGSATDVITYKDYTANADINAGGDKEAYQLTRTITAASVLAWKNANNAAASNGAAYNWWNKAKALTTKIDAWWTGVTDNSWNLAFMNTGAQVGTDGDKCNESTGSWTNDPGNASTLANCKTACENANALQFTADDLTYDADGGENTQNFPQYSSNQSNNWCSGYSFDNSACKLQLAQDPATQVASTGGTDGDSRCYKMTNAKTISDAVTAVTSAWVDSLGSGTAIDATANTSLYDEMKTAVEGQATLDKNWVNGWTDVYYWYQVHNSLTTGANYAGVSSTLTGLDADDSTATSIASITKTIGQKETARTAAQDALTVLQADVITAAAAVTALTNRIYRADAEIAELRTLVGAGSGQDVGATNDASTGTLNQAYMQRSTALTAYTAADGAWGVANTNKIAADLAVVQGNDDDGKDGGDVDIPDTSMWKLRWDAQQLWTAAQGETTVKQGELTAAIGDGSTLEALRADVQSKTDDWDLQQLALTNLQGELATAEGELATAKKELAALVLACQVAAYDTYRETLEGKMVQRLADLKAIKTLMEKNLEDTPEPGTVGARCEKALSNGTFRPARGETACKGTEEAPLCCGASRVWMPAGVSSDQAGGVVAQADAMWKTIETCQAADATAYDYQPPRAPMATEMPATVSVGFTCIEGAKKLAAAASAVAAAVYMLA